MQGYSRAMHQHRTAFCALKHTRSSYKPAIYMDDNGLSFNASSEVFRGKDLAFTVGGGKVRTGSSTVWEGGMKRAHLQTERDGGDSFVDTADSSIEQQMPHRLLRVEPNAQEVQASNLYGQRVVVACFSGSCFWGAFPLRLEVAVSGVKGGASSFS